MSELVFSFDAGASAPASRAAAPPGEAGIDFKDLQTSESSLEDIFVSLVKERA
jgi:ABC-2 type transport system ATP-binding protein